MKMRLDHKSRTRKIRSHAQQGFTLLEVVVAMGLMVVALVSLAGVFAYGFSTVQTAQYDMLAKAEAKEVMESIFAARNSGQLSFDQIDNVGPTAVFLSGYKAATIESTTDGLFNTVNASTTAESLRMPGPDGVLGNGDDVILPFTFMQRQIAITAYADPSGAPSVNLKQITVSVQYQTGRFGQKTYSMNSYISKYR